jgi:predicted RNase H-like HicB family nuclease
LLHILSEDKAFRWTELMLKVEIEHEEDGRWIAEVPALPGVLTYGDTEAQARAKVKALALRVIADRLENGEDVPREIAAFFEAA